ncbi:glycosyltransferase family 2 protein [Salegentibacter sp. UBA1130]|uniref:glycosyltransferase family 2 protein n=1 Tax=Salegentibacter sp. UBA1130 TaxID=1947451 RepID=UPI00257B2871|nr:glycosyltransferase family 2 protein [Salegentibacter sp. UBA1130]
MDLGLVSIIIPTYNRAELLSVTLEAFKKQTYKNWECLIVDDGSTDNTADLVNSFMAEDSRFIFYQRHQDLIKGPATCRNLGLDMAKGNFIQFFDDDDIPMDDMLERKIKLIVKRDADAVISALNIYNCNNNKLISINSIKSCNLVEDYFKHKISWYICGPMWRKSFLIEKFDSEIELMDDWDFNLRNIYNKPRVEFISDPLMNYCKRINTLKTLSTTRNIKQLNSEFLAFRKHFRYLKKKGLLDENLRKYYIYRIINIFRKINEKKTSLRFDILKEAIINLRLNEFKTFLRLSFGLMSYSFFYRGYRLIYYKE